jgi:hypothetical protein
MTSPAVSRFINTIIQHFPPFRWDEEQEKAWVNTMIRELAGFSDEVLDKTAAYMVRTRKDRKIPLVSECIGACLETRRFMESERKAAALPIDEPARSHLDWTAERLKLADELMGAQLGQQAFREGWDGACWEFARKNQRLPQPPEIEACKRDGKGFESAYALCVRAAGEKVSDKKGLEQLQLMASLEKLGASIIAKKANRKARLYRGARFG